MSTAAERKWFAAVAELETCVLCGRHGVQVSHSNVERGLGQKSKPWMTAALCPKCHDDIDNAPELSQVQRRALHFKAICRTHEFLIESGKLRLA